MQSVSVSYVEAIEEGKIVKVSESYAIREGLTILRKPSTEKVEKTMPFIPTKSRLNEKKSRDSDFAIQDELKKKPTWQEKQVLSELIDNFNWAIQKARKSKGLSRFQLSRMVGVSEPQLKILEYGKLPSNDFVLIHKLQEALGINLRKNRMDMDSGLKKALTEIKDRTAKADSINRMSKDNLNSENSISGDDIELLED